MGSKEVVRDFKKKKKQKLIKDEFVPSKCYLKLNHSWHSYSTAPPSVLFFFATATIRLPEQNSPWHGEFHLNNNFMHNGRMTVSPKRLPVLFRWKVHSRSRPARTFKLQIKLGKVTPTRPLIHLSRHDS